jgi:hypothetical protein
MRWFSTEPPCRQRRLSRGDIFDAPGGNRFHRLDEPLMTSCRAADLAGLNLHAVAGIGSPSAFSIT